MAEAKAKWDDVGDRFTEIGKHLKERYDANAAFGSEDGQDKEKVNDALREIGDALDAGFTAIGDSLPRPRRCRDRACKQRPASDRHVARRGRAIDRSHDTSADEIDAKRIRTDA